MRAISLVEKGWGGSRQLSIRLTQAGVNVRHFVKGTLPQQLLEVLAPYNGMQIIGIPKRCYRIVVWVVLMLSQFQKNAALVIVDNRKTADRVRRIFPGLRYKVVLVLEEADGSPRIAEYDSSRLPPIIARVL